MSYRYTFSRLCARRLCERRPPWAAFFKLFEAIPHPALSEDVQVTDRELGDRIEC